MVELFKNRIEFSNADSPLVSIERIVDTVPISINENIVVLCINVVFAKKEVVDMIKL